MGSSRMGTWRVLIGFSDGDHTRFTCRATEAPALHYRDEVPRDIFRGSYIPGAASGGRSQTHQRREARGFSGLSRADPRARKREPVGSPHPAFGRGAAPEILG